MRIILISSYFRAKKDCLLWEDNTSDTFHLFNRLKFSLFFWCPEGAISQLDTSSEDCNFFTEDCRTVTSLLQPESSTGVTFTSPFLLASHISKPTRFLIQELCLESSPYSNTELYHLNGTMPLVYLMLNPLLPLIHIKTIVLI